MSIAGCVGKSLPELQMPKQRTDELSTCYEGPVLTGEKSPEIRRVDVAKGLVSPGTEFYDSVEDYDPVLRAHCWL